MGLDGIPIEVWRTLEDIAIVWLTKLFNLIFRSNKMSDEWRRSILVPIFKNKGGVQNCTNYRRIKLMSHTMKLWERIIKHRLRGVTNVTENQFGFMLGRSTMEAIFLISQLMERGREQKKDLHMIFMHMTWRKPTTKCLGMSCGGFCRSTKSLQSTLPSLRICTIML
jgi:hypothetical protein